MSITFGIVISTYQRKDGSTLFYLKRTLQSIKRQTYQNYHVFLIGDKYEDEDEFNAFAKELDTDKITTVNLEHAVEREKYASTPYLLWLTGGVNATNVGVDLALEKGISYIAMLDHDDYWTENHLELISLEIKRSNPLFICSVSSHQPNAFEIIKLPAIQSNRTVVELLPLMGRMIKSACFVDFSRTKLRIRDAYAATGRKRAGDGDLWQRLNSEMKSKGLIGKAINVMTCYHDHEGHTKHTLSLNEEHSSLDKLKKIVDAMEGKTFHHHYHILYDLRNLILKKTITYVEIGAYCGASASLMASHTKRTDVISLDLGAPIPPRIPKQNVAKFKNKDNNYTYIQGDSHSEESIAKVKKLVNEIDILFIDGDHSYHGVKADFEAYRDLIADGGFVVFDDYLDWEHSSHVKHAVDEYVQQDLVPEFDVIGSLPNNSKAHPIGLKFSNVFILKKKGK